LVALVSGVLLVRRVVKRSGIAGDVGITGERSIQASMVAGTLLTRGSFNPVDDVQASIQAVRDDGNQAMSRPFTWVIQGKP
jgi:hypothetical protein